MYVRIYIYIHFYILYTVKAFCMHPTCIYTDVDINDHKCKHLIIYESWIIQTIMLCFCKFSLKPSLRRFRHGRLRWTL